MIFNIIYLNWFSWFGWNYQKFCKNWFLKSIWKCMENEGKWMENEIFSKIYCGLLRKIFAKNRTNSCSIMGSRATWNSDIWDNYANLVGKRFELQVFWLGFILRRSLPVFLIFFRFLFRFFSIFFDVFDVFDIFNIININNIFEDFWQFNF